MKLFNLRKNYFYAFIAVVILLMTSFYLQYYRGMMPCPLCIFQRITLGFLGVIFFLGAMTNFKNCYAKTISSLSFIFAILGAIFAGRQAWLQHLPVVPQNNCGTNLYYLLQALPFDQSIKMIFTGTAECSSVTWQLFYLSLAEWSLIFFIIFAAFSIFQCFHKKTGK